MTPILSLLLDLSVIVMLIAFMLSARQLNTKLKAIKAAQADFDAMVQRFTLASNTAQRAMADMREAAESEQSDLKTRTAEAKALFEELQFMIDAGNNLADRLEQAAGGARQAPATPKPRAAAQGTAPPSAPKPTPQAGNKPSAAPAQTATPPPSAAAETGRRTPTRAEAELLAALQAAGRAA